MAGFVDNLVKFSIRRLEKRMDRTITALNELRWLDYKFKFGERDDDIYVATFPKSGTTLMQMLLYQLTTDGNMDFNHIYDVSPWTSNAAITGVPPVELPSPRIIKTHDPYDRIPASTKGRFIFVTRDPLDCIVSNWHQEINYCTTTLSIADYAEQLLKRDPNWFKFTEAWLVNKKHLPMLCIRYEDLLSDFEGCVSKISKFLHIDFSAEAIARAYERTRFDYMKKYEDKFGDQPMQAKRVFNQFIRHGKTGEGEQLIPADIAAKYQSQYEREVKPLMEIITGKK